MTILATSSNPGAVEITNGPTYTFGSCDDVIEVGVHALALGSSTISFSVDSSNTANDPKLQWNTAEADFIVNVTEGGGGGGTECDADPAAPAWANAIRKANGFKSGAKQTTNLISIIAKEMTQGADFAGYQKSQHPEYETAVELRLEELTGKSLVPGSRPGWECTPTS